MKTTCENCKNSITYAEVDDNFDLNHEETILVCMVTDIEVESSDCCDDYEEKPKQWGEA